MLLFILALLWIGCSGAIYVWWERQDRLHPEKIAARDRGPAGRIDRFLLIGFLGFLAAGMLAVPVFFVLGVLMAFLFP